MANLRQEIKKAYSKTPMHKLDVLLTEETKWSRKMTIAQNKLDHVRMRINKFTKDMIKEKQVQAHIEPVNFRVITTNTHEFPEGFRKENPYG